MAVPISNHGKMADGDPTFLGQFIGVVAIGAFVCLASAIVWAALKYTVGIRVTAEEEMDGLDYSELGLEAYPEFVRT
jgi:Amt family ammonium transporter